MRHHCLCLIALMVGAAASVACDPPDENAHVNVVYEQLANFNVYSLSSSSEISTRGAVRRQHPARTGAHHQVITTCQHVLATRLSCSPPIGLGVASVPHAFRAFAWCFYLG